MFGAAVLLVGGSISQRLKAAGVSSRNCRGVLACTTVVLGGCVLPFVGSMPSPELKVACLVFGSAIGSTIYVVLPMIVSELTPQPQRAAMLAIVNSIVTMAGALAPLVMGSMIESAATPLEGYEHGYILLGCLMFSGGLDRRAVHPPRSRSQAPRCLYRRQPTVDRGPTRPCLKETSHALVPCRVVLSWPPLGLRSA